MNENVIRMPTTIDSPVRNGGLFNSVTNNNSITLAQEIENEAAAKRGEITLDSDTLAAITRHVLIAATAFGIHRINDIATYSGATASQVKELIKKHEKEIQEGIHCLTKGELVAKLSILATTSPKDSDKITAIKMLMDYRGLTAPEGGSRSFKRTVLKFALGDDHRKVT